MHVSRACMNTCMLTRQATVGSWKPEDTPTTEQHAAARRTGIPTVKKADVAARTRGKTRAGGVAARVVRAPALGPIHPRVSHGHSPPPSAASRKIIWGRELLSGIAGRHVQLDEVHQHKQARPLRIQADVLVWAARCTGDSLPETPSIASTWTRPRQHYICPLYASRAPQQSVRPAPCGRRRCGYGHSTTWLNVIGGGAL